MNKRLLDKRIPTILALFIVFLSVWITTALIQNKTFIIGRASPDTGPQKIRISNITDTSFSVSFITQEKVAAGISLDDLGGKLVLDDRDKNTNNQRPYYSHHITVSDLQPNTRYEFSIISNSNVYIDNEKKFSVTTASPIQNPLLNQSPIQGRILLPDSSHAQDTLVILFVEGAQTLSTVTKNTGEFTIPTNSIRSSDLKSYFVFHANTILQIDAMQKNLTSKVQTFYKNSSTIPPITLSMNYNFLTSNEKSTEIASESSELSISIPQVINKEIKIISPIANSSLIDQQPLIRGIAFPLQKVQISISGTEINSQISSDSNGIWSFRPSLPLSAGKHTVTIRTPDASGIARQVQQSFNIFSSGSQLAQTATPSATTQPTIIPTQKPTSTPTNTPTSIPTIITPTLIVQTNPTSTPTPIPTALPTSIPTQVINTPVPTPFITNAPTPIPTIRAYSTPAPTGNLSTIVLSAVSTIFIFTGIALLFILG